MTAWAETTPNSHNAVQPIAHRNRSQRGAHPPPPRTGRDPTGGWGGLRSASRRPLLAPTGSTSRRRPPGRLGSDRHAAGTATRGQERRDRARARAAAPPRHGGGPAFPLGPSGGCPRAGGGGRRGGAARGPPAARPGPSGGAARTL